MKDTWSRAGRTGLTLVVVIVTVFAFTAPVVAGKTTTGKASANKTGKKAKKGKGKKGTAKSSLKVSGPRSNTYHTFFNYIVSGYAAGAANYVAALEQLHPAGGCSKTYVAEATKRAVYSFVAGSVRRNHRYSKVAHFYARNHGTHGICAYLINSTTRRTYAQRRRVLDQQLSDLVQPPHDLVRVTDELPVFEDRIEALAEALAGGIGGE